MAMETSPKFGLRPLVIAHRGASRVARENTFEAFVAARALGADGVELDVRLGPGGVVVVHHDPLEPGPLPGHVPRLEGVLEVCEGMVVDVEIKNHPGEPGFDPSQQLAATVASILVRCGRLDDTVVASFDPGALDAALGVEPRLNAAWLAPAAFDAAGALDLVAARGYRALHLRHEGVDAAAADAARQRGVALWAWTVDDPERIVEMATAGVDAVITNVPDVALAALAGRSA